MEIQKLILTMAATAAAVLAQNKWPGVEPGVSTRAEVERVAGAPVQAMTPTLAEYRGPGPGDRAFVQFRASGVVERVELLLSGAQERSSVRRALGLGEPEVTRQNARGLTEEMYGSKLVVLTLGASGVERVAYYSRELFEVSGGRVPSTPAVAGAPVGSRLPAPIGPREQAGTPPAVGERSAPPSPTVARPPSPGVSGAAAPTASTSITLPAATKLRVSMGDRLSTARNRVGDRFTATLAVPVVVDDAAAGLRGETVAVKGARVDGRIVSLTKSGRVRGVGEMTLELTSLEVYGAELVPISTSNFTQTGEGTAGSDGKKLGAATGIGAAIGALAGGGKGAAVGAGAGAAAAAGAILITRGKPAELDVEALVDFELSLPVTVRRRDGR